MAVSVMFEGPEGAGKSLGLGLYGVLIHETTNLPYLQVREPYGPIRELMFAEEGVRPSDSMTHMLLFAAQRNELYKTKIDPFYESHKNGIIGWDRGWPSTYALQNADGVDTEYTNAVQKRFERYPDIIALIDLPVEESLVRVGVKKQEGDTNWRDDVTLEKYRRIRANYLAIAREHRDRVVLIDGFQDPWKTVNQLRTKAIQHLADRGDEVDREILNELVREVTEDDLSQLAIKTSEGGRYRPEKYVEKQERERERLQKDFPDLDFDRDLLHNQMITDWRELGLIEGNNHGRERK